MVEGRFGAIAQERRPPVACPSRPLGGSGRREAGGRRPWRATSGRRRRHESAGNGSGPRFKTFARDGRRGGGRGSAGRAAAGPPPVCSARAEELPAAGPRPTTYATDGPTSPLAAARAQRGIQHPLVASRKCHATDGRLARGLQLSTTAGCCCCSRSPCFGWLPLGTLTSGEPPAAFLEEPGGLLLLLLSFGRWSSRTRAEGGRADPSGQMDLFSPSSPSESGMARAPLGSKSGLRKGRASACAGFRGCKIPSE